MIAGARRLGLTNGVRILQTRIIGVRALGSQSFNRVFPFANGVSSPAGRLSASELAAYGKGQAAASR